MAQKLRRSPDRLRGRMIIFCILIGRCTVLMEYTSITKPSSTTVHAFSPPFIRHTRSSRTTRTIISTWTWSLFDDIDAVSSSEQFSTSTHDIVSTSYNSSTDGIQNESIDEAKVDLSIHNNDTAIATLLSNGHNNTMDCTTHVAPYDVVLEKETIAGSKRYRFRQMIPVLDDLDRTIVRNAVPSMINLAVVPLVNSVDTFWVGRMGIALALAGQAAANQAFFTLYFLVNYLPTITAPLVASAVGSGDMPLAQQRVGESLFLSTMLGGLATILLVASPTMGLSLILPHAAPALEYARPYLRFRALSMVPALMGATGFAAFRGSLDTVTPLKVSLFTK